MSRRATQVSARERAGRGLWAAACCLGAVWAAGCSGGDQSGDLGRGAGAGTHQDAARGDGDGDDDGQDKNNESSAGGFGNSSGGMGKRFEMLDAAVIDSGREDDMGPDDKDTCGGLEIEPEIKMETIPGNVVFVFDKSGSMDDPWKGDTPTQKWVDARLAVSAALMPLQDDVQAAAIFFPDAATAGQCGVPAFDQAPQIGFMPGADFLTAWDSYWNNAPDVNGRTPLLAGLQVADGLIQNATLSGTTNVVIITDGEPNCSGGQQGTPEPVENLTPLITQWAGAGIATYVVGLPGSSDAGSLLDGLAVAGGTGAFIPADDPTALETELAKIVGLSVSTNFDSCTIGLPEEPPDLNDVKLVVEDQGMKNEVPRDLGTGGGWTIKPDGSEIVLQGVFCDLARDGEYERIGVVFGCVDAPPLPPPEPKVPD